MSSGTLHIIATPIGNLGDLSPRAVEVLRAASLILAEDTRAYQVLATRFALTKPAVSCHEHNERDRIESALAMLRSGEDVALISEAGTPLISDPGYRLVRATREAELPVSPIPGPCAAIAALSVSGFESDAFLFRGFLPPKKGKRRTTLLGALQEPWTVIFYESTHRILSTMGLLSEIAPRREIFVARELTKKYEECFQGTAEDLATRFRKHPALKGEFVLILRRNEESRHEHSRGPQMLVNSPDDERDDDEDSSPEVGVDGAELD